MKQLIKIGRFILAFLILLFFALLVSLADFPLPDKQPNKTFHKEINFLDL